MCLTPSLLRDGTLVACRGCRVCRDNRVNDLVGRCLAEKATSAETFAVTLTYRGDCPESVVLRYHDIQKMLKRLRFDGHKVRYLVAGEYGDLKGRAHWHCVLFFKNKIDGIKIERNFHWEYWDHGFSYFQHPGVKGMRYVLKYCLKQMETEGYAKSISMSKKPPLGHEYFMSMVNKMVKDRIPLHSPEYSFSESRLKDGTFKRYWLQGRMREMVVQEYADQWRRTYGDEPPYTPFLYKELPDAVAPREWFKKPDAKHIAQVEAFEAARRDFRYQNSRDIALLLLHDASRKLLLVCRTDGFADVYLDEGKPWIVENGRGVSVAAQLSTLGLEVSSVTQACQWLAAKWQEQSQA